MTGATALLVAVAAAAAAVVAAAAATTATAAANCGAGIDASEVRLAALLALHEGPNCSQPSLRGAQQQAAINAAATRAAADLRRDGLTLGVRVLDTCGSIDEATKSTMRALVAAGQTCLKPPLFLGFIGPEDAESLAASRRVSEVFGAIHVVPWSTEDMDEIGEEVLPTVRENPAERAQALLTVLRRFQWKSFVLVRTRDSWSTSVTKEILASVGSPSVRDVCVAPGTLEVSGAEDDSAASMVNRERDKHSGVLVVSAQPITISSFLRRLGKMGENTPGSHHVMVALRDVGLSAQDIRTHGPTTIVQFTSPSTAIQQEHREALVSSSLWTEIVSTIAPEKDTDFSGLSTVAQDPSVVPLSSGVHLLAASAKLAQDLRCGQSSIGPCDSLLSIPPSEWKTIVSRATASAPSEGGSRKVRFGMDLSGAAAVFFRPAGGDKFDLVATVSGGRTLELRDKTFRPPEPSGSDACGTTKTRKPPTTRTKPSTTTKSTTRTRTKPTPAYVPEDSVTTQSSGGGLGLDIDWSWLFGSSDVDGSRDERSAIFNQTLYMITGAGVIMLLVFSLCVCIVYRCFRVRSSRESSSDDSSTRSKRSAHS